MVEEIYTQPKTRTDGYVTETFINKDFPIEFH